MQYIRFELRITSISGSQNGVVGIIGYELGDTGVNFRQRQGVVYFAQNDQL
jgi:hypothetical protein